MSYNTNTEPQATPTSTSVAAPAVKAKRQTWRLALAVVLGIVSVLVVFIAEIFGMTVGLVAMAACFLLSQFLLSMGRTWRQSLPILIALNFVPVCLGVLVLILERSSGAWTQGVAIIVLGLTCSCVGAALAARITSR